MKNRKLNLILSQKQSQIERRRRKFLTIRPMKGYIAETGYLGHSTTFHSWKQEVKSIADRVKWTQFSHHTPYAGSYSERSEVGHPMKLLTLKTGS